ncbi:MAG: putative anti-sigma factor [Phycisphaerales bacterium]|nr:putative anti-sigma factor [Phycisphaerales bacterium]
MSHQDALNLMIAYAAGTLEGPEQEAVRARLAAGDPVLTGMLAEAELVLARLAGTCAPVEPSPGLRQWVLDGLPDRAAGGSAARRAIRLTSDENTASAGVRSAGAAAQPSHWYPRLAAAAAVALVVVAGLAYVAVQSRQARLDRLTAEYRDRNAQLSADLQDREARLREVDEVVGSSASKLSVLSPAVGGGTKTYGRVFVDPAGARVRVFVYDLVAPPPGKVYQLWLMPEGGGAPVPAPTFTVDANGRAVVDAVIPPGLTAVAGAAVSEEPPGGSTKPTTVRLVPKAL